MILSPIFVTVNPFSLGIETNIRWIVQNKLQLNSYFCWIWLNIEFITIGTKFHWPSNSLTLRFCGRPVINLEWHILVYDHGCSQDTSPSTIPYIRIYEHMSTLYSELIVCCSNWQWTQSSRCSILSLFLILNPIIEHFITLFLYRQIIIIVLHAQNAISNSYRHIEYRNYIYEMVFGYGIPADSVLHWWWRTLQIYSSSHRN